MKAIMLMFDTLNRRYLPPYGADGVHAPNFERLAELSATFDNCYGGSMPCMPARREMHTGRYNFLHRSWGPLEPFDDSVPQMLSTAGVHTHLVTDHYHYWQDGGATYHNRFSSYELFRGQEGDKWKGQVADPPMPPATASWRAGSPAWRQDWVNRQHMSTAATHPQTLTVDAGLEFIRTNHDSDRWFLQIECFDPHEPFLSYPEHRAHYLHTYDGDHFDWPDYRRVAEDQPTVDHLRAEYSALLTMCDASLGRVLDAMDAHRLWDDTMLIVCTDHGLLLGEHGWWGKNVQPWYDENIHTPLFIWDPRTAIRGERRASLVQTIDFGPTLLEYFGLRPTPDMQGVPLAGTVATDQAVRVGGLFGNHGGHVNVTDGRYVYMRACADPSNQPLEEYTLMPTHMASRFATAELQAAELAEPFAFTKGVPLLRIPGAAWGNPHHFGTLLFDLEHDPEQQHPLVDDDIELRMATLMTELMREQDAPAGQFERMGLPATGEVGAQHLLAHAQREQVARSHAPLPPSADFRTGRPGVLTPIGELLNDPRSRDALVGHLPMLAADGLRQMVSHLSPYRLAAMTPAISADQLRKLEADLATADTEVPA
ncbi:sulfatase [Streptomyces sp. NPDC090052]|uniref:sulfatase n=1 Tax=unclassified Streptomyces TaxID=2593676 RepID=UPI002257985C|nr:sulfatase [Streptomyces sp. NBC_01306]MCX4724312.1 sulfatase [Streptomyces sp. NBC_01306]